MNTEMGWIVKIGRESSQADSVGRLDHQGGGLLIKRDGVFRIPQSEATTVSCSVQCSWIWARTRDQIGIIARLSGPRMPLATSCRE